MRKWTAVVVAVLTTGLAASTTATAAPATPTAAPSAVAAAVPAATARVPVARISVAGTQARISQRSFRPGVVEFRVGTTFRIPGPEGGPDSLTIVRTEDLGKLKLALQAVFGGDPNDPDAGAKAAAAMAEVQSIARFYGGGKTGVAWQVQLPRGNYAVVSTQSFVMGVTKAMRFRVAGDRRAGAIHATAATMSAISVPGGNAFRAAGTKTMGSGWLRFENRSKEIHFLSLSSVKPGTTDAMVQAAFQDLSTEPDFFTGKQFDFEVISPKVAVAIKGPFEAGRWFAACFVNSTTDGTPHAMMGMWKLVDVA